MKGAAVLWHHGRRLVSVAIEQWQVNLLHLRVELRDKPIEEPEIDRLAEASRVSTH